MATVESNAINADTVGIVGNTGTSFTGSAVTQYDVLVGGATSSTISSVGPGSAGQVLQSGGNAANPAYSTATYPATATGTGKILRANGTNWVATTATFPDTAGTSGNVLTSDGTNWSSSAPAGGSGSIVQQIRAQSTTATSSGTGIAITTTPTTGNTVQLITATITPKSASNILIFQFSAPYKISGTASDSVNLYLFNGSTFITGSSNQFQGNGTNLPASSANFLYYTTAGSTSTATYAINYGVSSGSQIAHWLSDNAGTALYGASGNSAMSFIITEVTP